jgi:hypothetical protein
MTLRKRLTCKELSSLIGIRQWSAGKWATGTTAPMPVSPRLVFSGTDGSGKKRHVEIMLDGFLHLPHHAGWAHYMAETGQYVASFSPYITNVEEVYFLRKRIVDLRKAGYEKEELVLIISGYDIRQAKMESHAYLLFAQNEESIGFKLIDTGFSDLFVRLVFMRVFRLPHMKVHVTQGLQSLQSASNASD